MLSVIRTPYTRLDFEFPHPSLEFRGGNTEEVRRAREVAPRRFEDLFDMGFPLVVE